jgi:hypothetical protein
MNFDRDLIERVKDAFTIPDAWQALRLPGEPRASCRVPWRDDKRASLGLFADGRRWHDHSKGEGGDVIAFVREATGLSFAEALAWCAAHCGLGSAVDAVDVKPRTATPRTHKDRKPEPWPTIRPGTPEEHATLCELRGFSLDALRLCEARGLLHFGCYDARCPWRQHWQGLAFWAFTDQRRQFCELRLLTGELWPEREDPPRRKAHGLGEGKAFPCGLIEAAAFPLIAITEGIPDAIAAHDLALMHGMEKHVGVCAVLGAGVDRFAPECLPIFAGKRVRIYRHEDEAGDTAMRRWARQIADAGAQVDAFALGEFTKQDGTPGKDLADLLRAHPASLAANPHLRTNPFPH